MKARLHWVVLLLMAVGVGAAAPKPGKTLDQLKAEADAAHGGHRAQRCSEVALRLVDQAAEKFGGSDMTQGQATVQEVVAYAAKAREAALSSRSKLKETEINLREAQRHLENLKHTLPADERPPLDAAEKTISDYRQEIQDEMFGVRKKKEDKKKEDLKQEKKEEKK